MRPLRTSITAAALFGQTPGRLAGDVWRGAMVRAGNREGQGPAARHDGGGQAGSSHCSKVADHWPPRRHNAKGQAINGFVVSVMLCKGFILVCQTAIVLCKFISEFQVYFWVSRLFLSFKQIFMVYFVIYLMDDQ